MSASHTELASFFCATSQPGHPSKDQEPVSRKHLHNSVAKDGQKAGATTKKGGAGGKGTWGKVGDEFDAPVGPIDKKDPMYDEEEDDKRTTYLASE